MNLKRACSVLAALALLIGSNPTGFRVTAAALAAQTERSSLALPPEERGSVALDQSLRDLTNPYTVLSIGVRPGDADEGTLAYYRKALGARTVLLFATRGETGDRATCGDTGAEPGFTRTREALEAARVLGADLFFLNLRDFGYSKSANEALSVWGHDDALGKLVRAIRSLRPDVIITNHNPATGDGQQQALAQLTREAFDESANPERAPEAGSGPWRVRRLFERAGDSRADVSVTLSERDAARGQSYAEIGLAARRRNASIRLSGSLDAPPPDHEKSHYKLIAAAPSERLDGSSLVAGLTLAENLRRSIEAPRVGDLSVLEATTKPSELIDALYDKLLEKRAEGSAEQLQSRYGAEYGRVIRFTASLEHALAMLLGLSLEVTISDRIAVPGQKLAARAVLRNGSSRPLPVVMRMPEALASTVSANPEYKSSDAVWVAQNASTSRDMEYEIPKDAEPTLPRAGHLHDEQYYPIGSSLPGALPAEPFGHRLGVLGDVGLRDVSIPLAALARYDVSSSVEISTIPFAILTDWSKPRAIEVPVRVRNRTHGPLAGALWVVPLALTDDGYEPVRLRFTREDEEIAIKLNLKLPILKPPLAPDVLLEFRREKPASPEPLGLAKILIHLIGFEVAEALNVGYISGGTAWLADALYQLGITASEIAVENMARADNGSGKAAGCSDLARFDTIVIDSCAYLTRPDLMLKNSCLLKYVKEGGNLVVFDQRPDDWNLITSRSPFAPYPIKLSADRVASENAPVRILDEDHPLLSKPNRITGKDFDGWVSDQAVNLPREWSSKFTPLLESSDPGESPSQGGLLVARYGEGSYVFTSFNWRSQLIAMNPGAYRMLANFVSFPKTNSRPRRVRSEKPTGQ
ncbi:MAG: PIG-L family deacetylase [Acidobacteriota bacterium]